MDDIFDPVARMVLVMMATDRMDHADAEVLLSTLIDRLLSHGWNTPKNSLYEYRAHPFIVRAFASQGVTLDVQE